MQCNVEVEAKSEIDLMMEGLRRLELGSEADLSQIKRACPFSS